MFSRRSLKTPIVLAIVMIVLLIVLTVGWVLLSVFGALTTERLAAFYWALLPIGSTFIALLLAGVVVYLVLTIKAINLTRRQSNFIDSVTHELKSPLASMKLALQTISRYQVDRAQQAEFLRFMLDDLERLDRLINQILAAGRVESGRVEEQAADVDLAAVLRQCAEAVCLNYRLPPQTVQLDCEPCAMRARQLDLELIFRNLIDNAVKYAGNPPQVAITLQRRRDGQARVCVSDNGHGIPKHLRRQIFGRFVRVGSELEREKPGTGLGLYIVRTAVHRLHGEVHVRDREPQPGTVFEVILPAGHAEAPEQEKVGS